MGNNRVHAPNRGSAAPANTAPVKKAVQTVASNLARDLCVSQNPYGRGKGTFLTASAKCCIMFVRLPVT